MRKIIPLLLMALVATTMFSSLVAASPIDDFFSWIRSLFGIPYSVAITGEACLVNSDCLTNICTNPLSSLNTGATSSIGSQATFSCPSGAKICKISFYCPSNYYPVQGSYTSTTQLSNPYSLSGGSSLTFACGNLNRGGSSGGTYKVQYYGTCTGYVAPNCGNSVVETGEQCDPPNSVQQMPDGGYEKCNSFCSWDTEYYLCGGSQVSTKPVCSAGSTISCPSGQIGTVTCKSDCSGYDYSNCQVQTCTAGKYYCQGNGIIRCNSLGTGYDSSTLQNCGTKSPNCPECVNNQYCTYPNKQNCENGCLNGVCGSCTPSCGTEICSYVIEKCTADCVADQKSGCGINKCVNGRQQGWIPDPNYNCGSGYICQ